VHVTLTQHQFQLLFAEIRIHLCQGEDMEGKIPGRLPGILPLVRHGDHVAVLHVVPGIYRQSEFEIRNSEIRNLSAT
jgi:hypothetical protein